MQTRSWVHIHKHTDTKHTVMCKYVVEIESVLKDEDNAYMLSLW